MYLSEKIPYQVHHFPIKYGEPFAMFSKKECPVEIFQSEKEGDFAEHPEVRKHIERQSDRALQGQQEALSKLSETEFHTIVLLEEQGSQILSEAIFGLLLQETRAEHTVNSILNLNCQLRSHDSEIFRREQEYEVARHEQDLLRAELQSRERERVHQEARRRASLEMEELKQAQTWGMDEYSRQELRESQYAVTRLYSPDTGVARRGELHE